MADQEFKARIDVLERICAECYQVIGSLAYDCGRFDDDHVIKALDNASAQELTHEDVLPFPSFEPAVQNVQAGELDPRVASDEASRYLRYVESFNGQIWSVTDQTDRRNLAAALDNLMECAAMLASVSDRLSKALSQDAALDLIAGIAEGSGTLNSMPNIAKIARRALYAAPSQPVAGKESEADCYSHNDGDSWCDCPDDIVFVHGLKVGDEYEVLASVRAWPERYRVTKAPDDESDDYEVERITTANAGKDADK